MASIIGAEEEASERSTLFTGINLFTACLVCLIALDVLGWVLSVLRSNYKLCRMGFVGLAPRWGVWGGCLRTSAFLCGPLDAARSCLTGAALRLERCSSRMLLSQSFHRSPVVYSEAVCSMWKSSWRKKPVFQSRYYCTA